MIRKTVGKTALPKENKKKAYVFFNCDEAKQETSMNPYYNREVFRNTGVGKKALWAKIQSELDKGSISIAENRLDAVKEAILGDDPTSATDDIKYGVIISFTET